MDCDHLQEFILYLNLSKGTSISNLFGEAYFHSFSLALLIILDVSVYERVEGFGRGDGMGGVAGGHVICIVHVKAGIGQLRKRMGPVRVNPPFFEI